MNEAGEGSTITKEVAENNFQFPLGVASVIRQRKYDTLGFDVTQLIPLDELKTRGVVMVNVLGGAERAIVQQAGKEDFSQKLFLTKEGFNKAKAEIIPEGISEEDLAQVNQDMGQFVDECRRTVTMHSLLHPEERQTGLGDFVNLIRTAKIKLDKARKRGLLGKFKKPKEFLGFKGEEEIIKEVLEEFRTQYEAPETVRGIPVQNISFRAEGRGLQGAKCPFLECPHRFRDPMGIRIYDQDGALTGQAGSRVRINEAVIHLASHGICNTGTPKDPDQHYISLQEYMPIFARKGVEPKEEPDVQKILIDIGLAVVKEAVDKMGFTADDNQIKEIVTEYYFPPKL